jgi:hypothetical protein
MKRLLILAALAVMLGGEAKASFIITQWNFDSASLSPSTGTGAASYVGGTTATNASGTNPAGFAAGNSSAYGWNTTTYANQSAGSGTRGVQFLVSTAGKSNIMLTFDHRGSGTASRWARVDYTLDGGASWTTGFWNNNGGLSPHDTFHSFNVDLSSVTAANNNAGFGFRIVSIFSPLAFDQNSSLSPFAANTAYMRANSGAVYSPNTSTATGDYGATGTWRFDNVTVSGVPEPTSGLLIGVGTLACAAFRRNRRNRLVS